MFRRFRMLKTFKTILILSLISMLMGADISAPPKDENLSSQTQQYLKDIYEKIKTDITLDEKVKASSTDATADYLDGKVAKSIIVTSDKLELSGDSASPGNSKYYGTNASGTKGWNSVSTDNNTSNVIFSFALGGGSASANAYGMILNDSITAANTEIMAGYWAVNGATYQTILTSKFTKIAGISTVTVWASIWQGGGGGGTASCKVIIGSVNGEKTAWSGLATPGWDSFTIDVSGLSNGSTYDVSIQISAGGAYMSYMDSIIGIAS